MKLIVDYKLFAFSWLSEKPKKDLQKAQSTRCFFATKQKTAMSSNQGNTGGNNVGNTMNAMQKQQVQQQQPQQQFRPITSPIGINPQSGPAPQQGPPAGTTTSLPPISQGFNTHAPYL